MSLKMEALSVNNFHYIGTNSACVINNSCSFISHHTTSNTQFDGFVKFVTANELTSKMSSSTMPLILDCRSFLAYNNTNIRGALNLNCGDKLTKRRLASGTTTVFDLLARSTCHTLLSSIEERNIVIYDEDTSDLTELSLTHPLVLVRNSLLTFDKDPLILKGGIKAFQVEFPQHCISLKTPHRVRLLSPTTPLIESNIESVTATEILPYLYLGNERDVKNSELLKKLQITHILNVTNNVPQTFEGQFTYKRLPATDNAHQNLKQYFNDAFLFIEEAARMNGKVLIHCQAGVSRSATLVIAYLMKRTSLNMVDAHKLVKCKRNIVAPNFNFMGQLLEFENSINEGIECRQIYPFLNVHLSQEF